MFEKLFMKTSDLVFHGAGARRHAAGYLAMSSRCSM
jgi:hypothetical protein